MPWQAALIPAGGDAISTGHDGEPSGAKTKMATIITMSRKLVPQRGWKREKRWAFSGVSGSPAS